MKALAPLALLALTAQAPAPPALPPNEIVAAAPAAEWVAIAASDLLVMELGPLKKDSPSTSSGRRVVIQLVPPPFSQGWVGNIRKLAAARWWDGTSINRVQDNYVVQWGDASEKKPLPVGLVSIPQTNYVLQVFDLMPSKFVSFDPSHPGEKAQPPLTATPTGKTRKQPTSIDELAAALDDQISTIGSAIAISRLGDGYAPIVGFFKGFAVAENIPVGKDEPTVWPVHCYGMVGVGRGMPPETGSGAELYTVIGHAPRHLDRNIALVGRVIEGIEHLSSLPRGTGALGFYEKPEERVPIVAVRIGNEVKDLPTFQYLSTESQSFARYADARANRRDAFFIRPAGGADICNIPVPVRRIP